MDPDKPNMLAASASTSTPSPSPRPVSERSHATQMPVQASRNKTELNRCLPGWQIALITFCGVIGVTIFSTEGEIMNIAGPAGLLVAWAYVAITSICVMEGLAEMIVMWPVSNAMVEFVKVFVDRDLAVVVGLSYWYTWSSVFATLLIAASDFSQYWIPHQTWRTIIFFVVVPIGLLVINALGVKWYGWIEGIGGAIKLGCVLAGIVFMIVDAARVGSGNIDDNFQHHISQADNGFVAVCMTIPILTYGFLGVEIVSVTAFEAKDRSSLRDPARFAAYGISALYFFCCLLEAVVVYWNNPDLPSLHERSAPPTDTSSSQAGPAGPGFYAVVVIAAREYGSPDAGWFFNACIIYFCISAANTALYVASRTLFGLAREIHRNENPSWILKVLKPLGSTSPYAKVPHWSLIVSAIAFFWLPFLQVNGGYSTQEMITILSTTGSIGGVFVWASQCLAYIRYHHWFHGHKKRGWLPDEYNRWNPKPELYPGHRSRTLLASLQPIPAWIGLIMCLMVVFVFSTANWWNGTVTFRKVITAFMAPIVLLVVFFLLKLSKPRLWVKLGTSNTALNEVTSNLELNSNIDPLTGLESTEMRGRVTEVQVV